MTTPPVLIQAYLMLLVVTAATYDLRFRRIPNWLSLAGLLAGLVLNTAVDGLPGLWFALKGAGLALLIYVPLFLIRAMGAGDGKLMAAVGAGLGPFNWFVVFVLAAVLGAILGLIVAARQARLGRTFRNLSLILISLRLKQAPFEMHPELDVKNKAALRMPHALPIALGVLSFLAACWRGVHLG